jgi:succinyl-diaminopimelate desuccinylase
VTSRTDLQLAQQLIRLPSTPESGGEPRVAELLADRLDSGGFTVTMHNYANDHVNLVARWGNPERPALCLSGHLDTVTVVEDDWTADPHAADVVGTRLYGRGAVDMKTGVAAMVRAAEDYVASPPPDAVPLALVLTAQEEVGSIGASAMTREIGLLPESRFLLIAEPTSNQPVLGHRGALWLDLVSQGRSCHGSTPHLGENAIDKLVEALSRVSAWAEETATTHEVLGRRTLNTGRIRGGTLRNIVPDLAIAELDFRTAFEEDAHTIPARLDELLDQLATVQPVLSLPPVYTSPDNSWVRLTREVASRHIDLSDAPLVARFFTDASVLTKALGDVPTVICGPGSPDQAHVVDEWCEIDQISTATAIYTDLLRSASQVPIR